MRICKLSTASLLCAVLFFCMGHGHAKNVDSLITVIKTSEDPCERMIAANKLAWVFIFEDADSAETYAQAAVDNAILCGDSAYLSVVYNTLASTFNLRNLSSQALHYYFQSLNLQQALGDKKGESNSYNNIGVVYRYLEDYDKALEYYEKSLEINLELNLDPGSTLHNISLCYLLKEDYTASMENAQRALDYFLEANDSTEAADVWVALGLNYQALDSLDAAMRTWKIAEKIYKRDSNEYALTELYINMASPILKKGDAETSLEMAKRGLELINRYEGTYDWKTTALKGISDAYAQLERPDLAYRYLSDYLALKDSLINEEKVRKGVELELNFNFEKQLLADSLVHAEEIAREQVRTRAQQKLSWSLAGVGVLLLLLVIGIAVAYRNKRRSNQLISAEKKRSELLLLNILPEETAQELKDQGYSKPKPYKEVSVMFTDFKGFTMMAEKMTATELVSEIDHCFKAFDHILERYPIEKIKTIGDAYMCVGGLPTENRTHAHDVVRAALEIRDFMNSYAEERAKEGREAFQIRIGVHTGPVVAGIVGTKKFAYDIWGDTVNTAARMESSGEVGKVNVSEATWSRVKDDFAAEYRGELEAKNKGKVKMYFVG